MSRSAPPRLQRSIGRSTSTSLLAVLPASHPNRWMKGGPVSRNRSLTMLHSFSNPHPSSSRRSPTLTGPPFFPSEVVVYPSSSAPFFLPFPGPQGGAGEGGNPPMWTYGYPQTSASSTCRTFSSKRQQFSSNWEKMKKRK